MSGRVLAAGAAALSAVLAGSAGFALAPGHVRILTACETRAGVRVITAGTSSARCRSGEKRVTWNMAGPRGPRGQAGPAGAPGTGLLPDQLALGVGVPVVLSGRRYRFDGPSGIACDGHNMWSTSGSGK